MSRKITIILAVFLISLAAVACDRGSSEIAGIDSSTELSALTDEQSDAFCGHLQGAFDASQADEELQKAGCLLGGVMSSMFAGVEDDEARAEVCQSTFDECMAEEVEEQDSSDEICPDADDRAECSATIAEVDQCIQGMLDWGFSSLKSLSDHTCADLVTEEGVEKVEAAMENLQSLGEGLPEIEACTALREKCPDFS